MSRWSFEKRVDAEEWVDDPALSSRDTLDTVREQAVVNLLLGGAHATLAHAVPFLCTCDSTPIRVLDAACGGGDVSRRLVDAARRLGKPVNVIGLDMSKQVVTWARHLSRDYPEIEFVIGDALQPPFGRGTFDLVILSTFIHHVSPEQVVTLFRVSREICRGMVIVADLVRSPWAYVGFYLFAHLLLFNRVTIHDGLVSVRRAYTPAELAEMAQRAGTEHWTLTRHQIARMTLTFTGMPASPSRGVR